MNKRKISDVDKIIKELDDILTKSLRYPLWMSIAELAKLLNMSPSTIQTFKDRTIFKYFRRGTPEGCMIKNCPEVIKLLQCYKYRNFEYERRLIESGKLSKY